MLHPVYLVKLFHERPRDVVGDGHHHAGESEQIFHDLSAGVGVEAGSNFIGNDEVIPAEHQPCDADALALPAREILAVLADEGVEAVGQGALAGMLCGGLMVFVWKYIVSPLGGVFGIYELLPAFLVSLAVCVVVSLVTPAPTEDILAEFDAAK